MLHIVQILDKTGSEPFDIGKTVLVLACKRAEKDGGVSGMNNGCHCNTLHVDVFSSSFFDSSRPSSVEIFVLRIKTYLLILNTLCLLLPPRVPWCRISRHRYPASLS